MRVYCIPEDGKMMETYYEIKHEELKIPINMGKVYS